MGLGKESSSLDPCITHWSGFPGNPPGRPPGVFLRLWSYLLSDLGSVPLPAAYRASLPSSMELQFTPPGFIAVE